MKIKKDIFNIILIDTLIQLINIFCMILVVVMLMPHNLNDAKKIPPEHEDMGRICVELHWPERNVDLDLWGHSPDDFGSVGYTRARGTHLSLFRDVIGFSDNPTHSMMEIQCSNDKISGEWTFNVHYYSNHEKNSDGSFYSGDEQAIDATAYLRIWDKDGNASTEFKRGITVHLVGEKDEQTLFDFIIDKNGDIIPDSLNHNYIPLKQGEKSPSAGEH